MWPILIVTLVALTVVLERIFWWLGRWMKRDPKRIEKVFTAIENGDIAEASRLSRGSRDPVLRMMWNGLNHQHASLQGALQVAAGIEIKRAGRFPCGHGHPGDIGSLAWSVRNDHGLDEILRFARQR